MCRRGLRLRLGEANQGGNLQGEKVRENREVTHVYGMSMRKKMAQQIINRPYQSSKSRDRMM